MLSLFRLAFKVIEFSLLWLLHSKHQQKLIWNISQSQCLAYLPNPIIGFVINKVNFNFLFKFFFLCILVCACVVQVDVSPEEMSNNASGSVMLLGDVKAVVSQVMIIFRCLVCIVRLVMCFNTNGKA